MCQKRVGSPLHRAGTYVNGELIFRVFLNIINPFAKIQFLHHPQLKYPHLMAVT
jgi:hypothetical protein